MNIINETPAPIQAYWVHPVTGELVVQMEAPLRPGRKNSINTYPTHTFVFVRADLNPSKDTPDMARHSHTGTEEQIYVSAREDGSFVATMKTSRDLAAEEVARRLARCEAEANSTSIAAEQRLERYKACATSEFVSKVDTLVENLELHRGISRASSNLYRNYTCADPEMEQTSTTDNVIWVSKSGHRVGVGTLFNSSHATIRYNKGFLTQRECDAIKDSTAKRLRRATTATADGGDQVSFSRRADQASISYTQGAEGDTTDGVLNGLMDKLFDYVNYFTDYDLSLDGQEGITAIRYLVSDEYHPHCDGACEGERHIGTGRVATMVMYCEMPPEGGGGGTTFTRAGVFTKGKPLDSVFFSYLGPDGRMDDGLTEHSGCPITEGSKYIATMWFRKGVSSAWPWTKSDPQGYPKKGYEAAWEKRWSLLEDGKSILYA
eukprot:scaffold170_cov281-Pinguiococcus_pyrenoidosus.AAC.12